MKTMNTPIFSPPITVEDLMSMKAEEEEPNLVSADRIPQLSPCIQLCGGNDYDHHTAADIDESEYNEQRNIDMTINLLRRQQQQRRQVKRRSVSPSKSNSSQEEGSSILDSISSIIESVQVCGLYICGFGCAVQEDDNIQKDAKDERKEAIDDTFMGKVISCPSNNGCGRMSQSADEIDISDNIRIAYIRSSASIHSELSEL